MKVCTLHVFDQSTLSIIARSGITRGETNNLVRFVIPYAKTVTYQSSYFIRAYKTWNVLSSDLRNRNIGLFSFKAGLNPITRNTCMQQPSRD